MAWPTIFANLAAGNQPLSIFDTMFNQVAQLVAIPCTASGANAIVLTGIGNAPTLTAYNNFQAFRFKAAGNSTAAVSVQFAGLAALPVFQKDGVTQATTGSIVGGNEYLVVFDQSRNSGAGGFYLEDAAQGVGGSASPIWGPFSTLASAATTDLSTVTTIAVNITGTATITSFGTGVNLGKVILFSGSLLLTNNNTSLVLPGGANIQTQANDMCIALSNASGNWFVAAYTKHSGAPILTGTSGNPLIGQGAGVDSVYALLGVVGGGTGLSNPAAHNVLCGEGASAVGVVAPSATSGIPLVSNGTGADPSFTTAVVAGGGTGATTLTAHGVLVGEGTSAIAATAVGSAGQVLTSNGAGNDPTFQAVPPPAAISGTVQNLTSSQTVTIPTGATKCQVILLGGGAGGGGDVSSAVCVSGIGGSGGPGAVCIKFLSGLTPGNTLALTIGGGGGGGAAGNNAGGNGGDTTLASGSQTITTLTAGHGTGGAGGNSNVGANGVGGTATNGDLNCNGGTTTATGTSSPPPMLGSSTGLGAANSNGVNAANFGSGGSGGNSSNATNKAGGNGSGGCAIFTWFA